MRHCPRPGRAGGSLQRLASTDGVYTAGTRETLWIAVTQRLEGSSCSTTCLRRSKSGSIKMGSGVSLATERKWMLSASEMHSRTDPIRVLIAGDHALSREGLRLFLAQQGDMEVIGEAADGPQALRMVEALHPDILLLDIQTPKMGWLEILANIQARSPRTNI